MHIEELHHLTRKELKRFLPTGIHDIADALSRESMIAVLEQFGGRRMWVPMKASDDHFLAQLIGLDQLEQLCAVCAGVSMYVPRLAKARARWRHHRVVHLYREGVAPDQIATRCEISDRTVFQILRDWKRGQS